MNLEFNEKDHIYTLGGVRIPSVTEVLKDCGLLRYDFSNTDAMEFGRAVHKATELYDQCSLDEETLDPKLRPYLDAWIRFRKDTGFVPEFIEETVCSETCQFAGRIDRTGFLNKDVHVLLDIKSGVNVSPSVFLQLAGYNIALREMRLCKPIQRRMAVLLKENGTYKISSHSAGMVKKTDEMTFLCALNIYNWKRRNK